jgi:hypothetical protein
MRKKYNALNHSEIIRLADAVREITQPFQTWPHAVKYFSNLIGRPITKSNIEGSCESLDVDVCRIVPAARRAGNLPLARMAIKVDSHDDRLAAIEYRLTEIEKLLE